MGKWIKKFSERARARTDSVDALNTTSTLSVSNRAHSENISVSLNEAGDPIGACPACGSGQWWRVSDQPWHCHACKPDMPLTATTLILPCHEIETRPVRNPARLRRMVEVACRGLSITPEQLWAELEENGDLADVECGAFSPDGLRLVAESLSASEAEGMLADNPEIAYAVTTGVPDPGGHDASEDVTSLG